MLGNRPVTVVAFSSTPIALKLESIQLYHLDDYLIKVSPGSLSWPHIWTHCLSVRTPYIVLTSPNTLLWRNYLCVKLSRLAISTESRVKIFSTSLIVRVCLAIHSKREEPFCIDRANSNTFDAAVWFIFLENCALRYLLQSCTLPATHPSHCAQSGHHILTSHLQTTGTQTSLQNTHLQSC